MVFQDFKSDRTSPAWNGRATPLGLKMGEYFDVKVQIGPDLATPLLLYPKDKPFCMQITAAECDRVSDLFALIQRFQPGQGRKAYFRAKVTKEGEMFISSVELFVRNW